MTRLKFRLYLNLYMMTTTNDCLVNRISVFYINEETKLKVLLADLRYKV